MPELPKHSVSVAGIVINEWRQVLLIQRRDNRHWEPPGGVLEIDETFEDGVRREILEETGVEVNVERLSGVFKNLDRGIVALVFKCAQVGGSASPTSESFAVEWVDIPEALNRMAEAYAIRVASAFWDSVLTCSHDGVRILDQSKAVLAEVVEQFHGTAL